MSRICAMLLVLSLVCRVSAEDNVRPAIDGAFETTVCWPHQLCHIEEARNGGIRPVGVSAEGNHVAVRLPENYRELIIYSRNAARTEFHKKMRLTLPREDDPANVNDVVFGDEHFLVCYKDLSQYFMGIANDSLAMYSYNSAQPIIRFKDLDFIEHVVMSENGREICVVSEITSRLGNNSGAIHLLGCDGSYSTRLRVPYLPRSVCYVANDQILVGDAAGVVHLIEPRHGEQIWSYRAVKSVDWMACLDDGRQLLASREGEVAVVDVEQRKVWPLKSIATDVYQVGATSDGQRITFSQQRDKLPEDRILCMQLQAKAPLEISSGRRLSDTLISANGRVLVFIDKSNGAVRALDF